MILDTRFIQTFTHLWTPDGKKNILKYNIGVALLTYSTLRISDVVSILIWAHEQEWLNITSVILLYPLSSTIDVII